MPSKEGQAQHRRGLCAAKGRLTLRRKEGSRAPWRMDGRRGRGGGKDGRTEGQTAFSDDCGSCPDDKGKNHPRISVPVELDSISRRRISSEQAYPEQVLSRWGASAGGWPSLRIHRSEEEQEPSLLMTRHNRVRDRPRRPADRPRALPRK